jgi:hypothetical protein
MMTDEQLEKIMNDMIEIYGDELPNPDHCPNEFRHILKMYMYYRGV